MVSPETDTPSSASPLHLLLHEVVDYAGLFPPAGLPLPDAIQRFARYRQSPHAWMLGRFVIPVGKLDALDEHRQLFDADPPFRFSVLPRGAGSASEFTESLRLDLETMAAFEARHEGRARCESIEAKLPPDLRRDASLVPRLLARVKDLLLEMDRGSLELFVEVPWEEEFDELLSRVAQEVAQMNTDGSPMLGLKIRTGGLEPALFPSVDRLARYIEACRDAGVSFKATAGLHHPVRHYSDSVGTHMHGFLNVFGAAVLARARNLSRDDIAAIVADEKPDSFRFNEEGFSWNGLSAGRADIAEARRFATSFGSCSFEEPREDLQHLNLL